VIVALNAGPILRHLSECVVCRSHAGTHEPTGTRADYDGLCVEGAKLLRLVDAALRAQGHEPPAEAGVPS